MCGAVVPITTMPTGWQLLLLMNITQMVLMMSMAISIRLIETNGSVVSLDADDEDDRHDLMMMMMMNDGSDGDDAVATATDVLHDVTDGDGHSGDDDDDGQKMSTSYKLPHMSNMTIRLKITVSMKQDKYRC